MSTRKRARQCEQPAPQPPTSVPSGSSSPSSTWKEWPQPHEETAFGLSILKPASEIEFRKSIVVPRRYGARVRVDDDRDALERELDVTLGGAGVEAEAVLEAGASATLDRDAEDERPRVLLLGHELPDLRRGDGRQRDEGVGGVLDGCHGLMVADGVRGFQPRVCNTRIAHSVRVSRTLRAPEGGVLGFGRSRPRSPGVDPCFRTGCPSSSTPSSRQPSRRR